MNRARVLALTGAVALLVSCGGASGGDQPGTTNPDATVVTDPREYVRAQMATTIDGYVASMAQQMPTVTSKVAQPDIIDCVKQRVNQLIDAGQPQPGQPEGDFASMLLNQAQNSLYGLVGMCAELSG